MRRRLGVGTIAAVVALSSACGTGVPEDRADSSGSTPTSASPIRQLRFVEAPCTMAVPDSPSVTCGSVTVPEDRSLPSGRQVVLQVAVVRTTASGADKAPDPVVYLHGGPGSGRLARGFEQIAGNPFLARRDVIYFDQRGVGLSTPSLNCPEREEAFIAALEKPAPYADELAAVGESLATCHDRLVSEGIDLDQYNTVTNAQDLDAVRRALGYEAWNLWGISYGTRLALEAMRSQPAGIRSVILDSVYPPSAGSADESVRSGERAFDALANGCATDPDCNAANPDVRATLERAADGLDAAPYSFDYTDEGGLTTRLELTGDDLVGGLFNALYDTTLIPLLPGAITALASGDRSIVPLIADDGIPFVNDTTEGAFLSYECADNGARLDASDVKELRRDAGRAGLLMLAGWQPFCEQWPVAELASSFGDDVRSSIPTLVIAGEYDPITPPAGSEAVAAGLADSLFVQVPRGGHGPGLDDGCTTGVMVGFLERLGAVDVSCVEGIRPAPFAG